MHNLLQALQLHAQTNDKKRSTLGTLRSLLEDAEDVQARLKAIAEQYGVCSSAEKDVQRIVDQINDEIRCLDTTDTSLSSIPHKTPRA